MRGPVAAILMLAATPAGAAPNVFWTFGFDLPRRDNAIPHFGAITDERRYAALQAPVLLASLSDMPVVRPVSDARILPFTEPQAAH